MDFLVFLVFGIIVLAVLTVFLLMVWAGLAMFTAAANTLKKEEE